MASRAPETEGPYRRGRTFWGIVGDLFFFNTGSSLAGLTTVVPSFLATLTSSAPLIGLSSTVANGGWLIPQIFAANSLAGRRRRKSSVLIPAGIDRALMLLIAPLILLLAPRSVPATLVVFFVVYTLIYVLDGFATIAWLDILGRCLTPQARARMISISTVAAGAAGIAGGAVVGVILSAPRLAGPPGYALLFLLCGVLWTLSFISIACIRESPLAETRPRQPWGAYFGRLASVVRSDVHLRRVAGGMLLLGGLGIAAPFYVVHGLEDLRFPAASVGIFTSAQLAGGILSGLVFGLMGERRGTRSVLRLWAVCAVVAPLVALGAETLLHPSQAALMGLYCAVFVIVGMQSNANMAGYLNWVLEYAPASDRPLYIGFANTLNGISMVMPMIGGWILSLTSSFAVLLVAAAVVPAAGLLALWGIPEPRRHAET